MNPLRLRLSHLHSPQYNVNMVAAGSNLTEEEIAKIVRTDLGKDVQLAGYEKEKASECPVGFLGDHVRLRVKLRGQASPSALVQRTYFVKSVPESERSYHDRIGFFRKEIGLYGIVFPRMNEGGALPEWHPRCLYTRGNDLLVLEDLAADGYYMYAERQLMDEEHVIRGLEALAAMHAACIAFEETSGTTAREAFDEYLFETIASTEEDHPHKRTREAAIQAQVDLVDLLTGYTEQEKEVIRRELPGRLRRILHMVKPSQKFRNVIVHGDLWSNNLLFVRGEDGRVASAKMIDFQISRYAPPAQDIVTFLRMVQTRRFYEENLQRLLRVYYDALARYLLSNGLRIERFMTWYELLGTCDYYEELGLITAVYFFQLILTPPDVYREEFASLENIRLDRRKMVRESFRRDLIYRERVTEVMDELIREYIL